MTRRSVGKSLGGISAVVLFGFTLAGFVAESQLTMYLQSNLGYRNPYFIFYTVHSFFTIIFPLHFLFLVTTKSYTSHSLSQGLSTAFKFHFADNESDPSSGSFPTAKFLKLVGALCVGASAPGLMWFAAISLAPITSVTAIWNSSSFFTYLITVFVYNLPWDPRKLAAVLLATAGVLAVVYGTPEPLTPSLASSTPPVKEEGGPSAPLIGNLLTLVASIAYACYQVMYKRYAALPSDPEHAHQTEASSDALYSAIPDEEGRVPYSTAAPSSECGVNPPPFALHPNLLTSSIGLCTLLVLWIPIPILDHFGVEKFALPPNLESCLVLVAISLCGVVFNAGFMVLLGVWGPVVASVGNLLTIVLVFLSDLIFGNAWETATAMSVLGSTVIVSAFSFLAYDMYHGR